MRPFASYLVFGLLWREVSCIVNTPFIPRSYTVPNAPVSYRLASKSEIRNNQDFYQRSIYRNFEAGVDLSNTVQEKLTRLGCAIEGVMVIVSGDSGSSCGADTPDTPFEYPRELQVAPIVREFLSQNNSIFLPEFWNRTAKLLLQERTIDLTYDDATKPDMVPENNPTSTSVSKVKSAGPAIVSRWNEYTSSLEESRVKATTETKDATLDPRLVSVTWRTSSLKTYSPTRTAVFSTMPSGRLAAIWARYFPEQFEIAPTSTSSQVALSTPISYSTLLVKTTTLRVLYEGDPIPTITSYILSPVYSSTTSDSSSALAASPAPVRELVISFVTICVVLMDGIQL